MSTTDTATEITTDAPVIPVINLSPERFVYINDDDLTDIIADYRALETPKAKAAWRKACDDAMRQFLQPSTLSIEGAQFASRLGNALVTAKPTAPAINPLEVLIDAVAELEMAAWLIKVGMVTPEGLDVSGIDLVNDGAVEWLDIHDMDRDALGDRADSIEAAARVFAGSKRSRSTGERGSIEAIVDTAFANLESGAFLTVSEIANKSGHPKSTGAIAARLFPVTRGKNGEADVPRECTLTTVTPCLKDGTSGPKGARKN